MRFKHTLAIPLAIVAAGSLVAVGCGSSDDSSTGTSAGTGSSTTAAKAGKVAVLLPDSKSSARWEGQDRKFLDAAFKKAGVEATIVNAEGDPAAQRTQAEQAITNGAKVLLLVNLDSGSGAAIIANAKKQGVKVIDYDRLTLKGGSDYYVSFDNTQVGKLQGQGLVDCLKAKNATKPVVAELNGSPTDNNATLFAKGYNSVLDPLYADGTYVKGPNQSVPDWDNQKALTIYEQMLQKTSNKINAVLAANDGLGNAAIQAQKARKLAQIPITGQDATAQGMQNILSGDQCMTVYKSATEEAGAAADLAIALAKGETPPKPTATTDNGTAQVPSVLLTPVAVNAANIAELGKKIIADGYLTRAEICEGKYAALCTKAGL